ncbi:MAG: hypothetical protein M3388_09805 [Acidobacteriota bacterium]|nr:hypothetical protein [Acidobacteriota bacterium]
MKIVDCQNCSKQTAKLNYRYNEAIRNGWNFFCSRKCRYAYQGKGIELFCAWCSEFIKKTPAQIRQTKTNVFCSKSCAAYYNNRHKHTGTRRSKLECYLEQQLKLNFPALDFSCNANKPIGLELDFYFPELLLAIELNGILHYQPIYGSEKLNRIQELDKLKADRCAQAEIRLCVIDNSNEPHFTQKVREKNWEIVKELVTSEKKRAGYTNEQVSLL